MTLLLGIDVGTTGTRAVLVDELGAVRAGATVEHEPMRTPRAGWAEQDPDDWWRAAVGAVRQVLRASGVSGAAVGAVGLTGQMHGLVLLGEHGDVLRSSIIWCDGRSQPQCDALHERIGRQAVIDLTCNPALPGFTAPKFLWVREHEPEVVAGARHILLPKDYVRYRLSSELATDVADASGTLLLDVRARKWSDAMLQALGIDRALLPEVVESPEVCARVSPEAAALTGLAAGMPIVAGAGDQAAGALGNGVVRPGIVSTSIGTSGVVFAFAEAPATDPLGRVHTFCHAVPGAWHVMGVTQGAGLSLRWFRDNLGAPETQAAAASGRDPYELLAETAAQAEPGCEGLVYLPYLMGERTPHLDPNARGAFFGLTAAHKRPHMVRAVLEGVVFSLRDSLEILREMGIPVAEIRASGGGARSPLWRQIQADVFGAAVSTTASAEGPAYGAALLAGVGGGVWRSVEAACEAAVRVDQVIPPQLQRKDRYDATYGIYRDLYPALKPLYARLAALEQARSG